MQKFALVALIGMASSACTDTDSDGPRPEVSAPARALGISEFRIAETAHGIRIEGIGEAGALIARAELSVGSFVMTLDDRGEVVGRQLTVDVGGIAISHESEGQGQLSLPLDRQQDSIRAFLLDPQVSGSLSRWGVGLQSTRPPPLVSNEVSYEGQCDTGFNYGRFDANNCLGATTHAVGSSCGPNDGFEFQRGDGYTGEFRCCYGGSMAAERACREPATSGSTPCGNAGGNGCAVCWSMPFNDCAIETVDWCQAHYCY